MKKIVIMALILILTPFIVAGEVSATEINSQSNNKTLKADLKVTNVVVHGSIVRGCNIAVTNTITNSGNGSAGGFWVNYYLKTHKTSNSYLLGKRYISGLKNGSSNTQNTLLYIPTNMPLGSYLLMASADATNSIVESNKNNNKGYSSSLKVMGPTYIIFDKNVGGDVLKNPDINRYIPKTSFAKTIFNLEKSGSVMLKFGNGNGPKVLISAGIHGNETEANIAIMKYLEYIKDKSINGTLYVIPFDIPIDTAKNTRFYHGHDPNRIANIAGSPGWNIIQFAHKNGVNYLLDVHSGGEVTSKGLLNVNTGTSNSQEVKWAKYITSTSGCVSRVQPLETGMVRNEAFKYNISTITMEVERDTAPTIVSALTEFKMIKAAMKFFKFPVPLI
ncbi:MAG: succinylglutamate desuccinylase/aspartoacylase family protein [Methanobacterium sp. ERen5]|nr:MAG: succinylglutamate desuccinylase/aspartoacylase family protein [Methanobacterium sp. ERen5]